MRIASQRRRIQPHLGEHRGETRLNSLFGALAMNGKRFAQRLANGHTGIERCIGILKYDRQLPAQTAHRIRRQRQQIELRGDPSAWLS